jgi:hypothetical protein
MTHQEYHLQYIWSAGNPDKQTTNRLCDSHAETFPVCILVGFTYKIGCILVGFKYKMGCAWVGFKYKIGCILVGFKYKMGCAWVGFTYKMECMHLRGDERFTLRG